MKAVVFAEIRQVAQGSDEQDSLGPVAQSVHDVSRSLIELGGGGVDEQVPEPGAGARPSRGAEVIGRLIFGSDG
jgi:hypothetical protein